MVFQVAKWNPNVQRMISSPAFEKYIGSLATMSESTSKTYRRRLYPFVDYIEKVLKSSPDILVADIRSQKQDPYDVLSSYLSYVKKELKVSDNYLRDLMVTTRAFLEFHKIFFNERQLRATIRMPKPVRRNKEPIDKNDVITILQNIHDPSLKLYALMLASTGMRAKEALSLRLRNLDLESDPGKIHIEAEFTKTRTDRFVFMTNELKKAVQGYLKHKYAPKIMRLVDEKTKTRKRTRFQLQQSPEDLLFAPYNLEEKREPHINTLYVYSTVKLNRIIDEIGTWRRERHSGFREVTRHTFRRFVKSTISDLGYADFSEWYIGHIASTYYRKKEAEKVEIFRKIEPYLTFLDVGALEAKGADMATRVDQMREENIDLRNSLKMMFQVITAQDEKSKQDALKKLAETGLLDTKKMD
jgi:integrase